MKQIVSNEIDKVNILLDEYLFNQVEIIPKLTSHILQSRGKQLRPLIALIMNRLLNNSDSENLIYLATSIELIHIATLVHDDVIDNGKYRRGQKTINFLWSDKHSILLGDYIFSKSFQLITKSHSIEAMENLSKASSKITEGEFIQLSFEQNLDLGLENY